MPQKLIPRFSVIFQIFAILHTLHHNSIIKLKKQEIEEAAKILKKEHSQTAQDIAKQLRDKKILIYSSPKMKGIGLYWKQAFNENAKIPAFNATFPELNHNEIEMFEKKQQDFHTIIIRDEAENMRINKRIDLTKKILKKANVQISDIVLKGNSTLAKIFSAFTLGATISSELADLTDTDAAKTKILDEFKMQL